LKRLSMHLVQGVPKTQNDTNYLLFSLPSVGAPLQATFRKMYQFGARENTASPRQHAPRFAENAHSNATCIEEENSEVAEDSLLAEALGEGSKSRLHSTSQHAATEGEGRACAERSAQASTLKPSQESKPAFEALIGAPKRRNCWATFTSRPCSATRGREVFPDTKLAATGIFVYQSWTHGYSLG